MPHSCSTSGHLCNSSVLLAVTHQICIFVQEVVKTQSILFELPCHCCLIPHSTPGKGLVVDSLQHTRTGQTPSGITA